jgi:hypothetical protein
VLLALLLFGAIGKNYAQKNRADSIIADYKAVKATAISTFNMFREPSYIMFGSGLGNLEPLVFEADIIPYFMISLNKNVRWGIELSPRILMRMYDSHSHPVRTPSYMPRVTFFYQFIDREKGHSDLFAYFSLLHHSNGQDGNFYMADGTTINTLNGSFSTNWLEGGFFLSRPNSQLIFITNYIKFYVDYSYNQDAELNRVYGRLRFFVNVKSTVKLSDVFKIIVPKKDNNRHYIFDQSIRMGWLAGDLNDAKTLDVKRLIFNYIVSFKPAFLKDGVIFVDYYYGQDYYNIYFGRRLNVVRIGIALKSSILF